MSGATSDRKPVVLVVDDLRESYDSLVTNITNHQSGRLAAEFDFEHVGSYGELCDWYQRHRDRFVSLIVQDVDFTHVSDERKLVGQSVAPRPSQQPFDARALQGLLIYGSMRQNNIDRVVPVLFVSCRVGTESITEMSSFLVTPGYGSCSFVPESAVGEEYYPRICEQIDRLALRPLTAEARRRWVEQHEMVIGRSRKMAFLTYEIERIGSSDAIVLLLGSSGAGKELVANALHRCSARYSSSDEQRHRPRTVNMAALDKNLMEDELFGHERGAYTGSVGERPGIFEAANGSTVFLDEIGDIDQDTQRKLLRTIEYYHIKRIGSATEVKVDVRIIATTNRTIDDLQVRFRPDFYARLAQHCIVVPSLRERWEGEPARVLDQDMEEFFEFIIGVMNRKSCYRRQIKMERAAVRFVRQLVEDYIDGGNNIFVGNVRTLRNIIERAYERAQYDGSSEVGLGHIMPTIGRVHLMNVQSAPGPRGEATIEAVVGSLKLEEVESRAIKEALAKHGNNQTKAADELGIHRDTLHRKMGELNL